MIYLMMILVAILAIGFAVWPLLREGQPEEGRNSSYEEDQYALRLRQLEEIAFDHAAGKLGGEEYETLRKEIQTYLDEANQSRKNPGGGGEEVRLLQPAQKRKAVTVQNGTQGITIFTR